MSRAERIDAGWNLVKGPLRVLLYGLVVFLLIGAAGWTGLSDRLATLLTTLAGGTERIATLIFMVGIAFAAFLWWLCSRYFGLLANPAIKPEQIAGLKDLPMALPEGTVRAVIALIVAVVGIPLLLFSKTLGLDASIAGYINGIVAGVFAYYFGTRASAPDTQTARQSLRLLDATQQENKTLQQQNGALQDAASTAGKALLSTKLGQQIARVDGHLQAAEAVLDLFGGVLPKGLIPEGTADILHKARSTLDAARGLAEGGITEDTLAQVGQAAQDVLGNSPLTALVRNAAGLFPVIGGLGPAAPVALVLGLGWRLGSEQYQRWRARVLDAPYDPKLIDAGLITPTSAELAMERSPIFAKAFESRKNAPGFYASLVDRVLRDDAADLLWTQYGADSSVFASRGALQSGLDEFRRQLLIDRSAGDLTQDDVDAVSKLIAPGAAAPKVEQVNQLIDGAAKAGGAHEEQRSAFEALVLLTGRLRQLKIDPAALLAELKP
jgi:hypothetical protein